MLGIGLALLSSVAWGISDFLGGLQTRRISALTVLLVTQPVGIVLALAVALTAGGDPLTTADVMIAGAAGGAAVLALGAFYHAMALGSVSVVSTIGALGVFVPVVAGLARGEQPAGLQLAGGVAAIIGILMVAREPDPEWRAANRASVGLAALAALGFGLFFLGLDETAGPQPTWTILSARVGGVAVLVLAALALRPSMRVERTMVPALVAIAFLDILANSLFAVATNHGLLALVSVAGSLYSAVTVLLARFVLREQLARSQQLGVVVALAGVALIAAGG